MTVNFHRQGAGPTKLIGLHGWFGDETTFAPLLASLDPAQVETAWLAHRGYGSSRSITGSYTIEEMAADALDVADHLGWESFSVIGHSMGGKAAQLVAATAPHRIRKLVTVASAFASASSFDMETRALFEAVPHDPESRRNLLDYSTGHRLSSSWIDQLVQASIGRTSPEVQAAYFESWADSDITETIAGCEVETLALAGNLDPGISPAATEEAFRSLFPRLTVTTIADSGHYPVDEVPLAVGANVARFLARSVDH